MRRTDVERHGDVEIKRRRDKATWIIETQRLRETERQRDGVTER